MKRLKLLLFVPMMLMTSMTIALTPAQTAHAVPCADNQSFFSLPTWYKYLDCGDDGKSPTLSKTTDDAGNETTNVGEIWLIGAAILEIMTRVAGILAVVFVVYGGFRYITSAGNPEYTAKARKSIINALAGLVIAISATTVISFVANSLSGGTGGGLVQTNANGGAIQNGLNIAYTLSGIIAALMVAIGGFRLITANGDPGKISAARQTIIYALIGMVVVLLAAAITGFVLSRV